MGVPPFLETSISMASMGTMGINFSWDETDELPLPAIPRVGCPGFDHSHMMDEKVMFCQSN